MAEDLGVILPHIATLCVYVPTADLGLPLLHMAFTLAQVSTIFYQLGEILPQVISFCTSFILSPGTLVPSQSICLFVCFFNAGACISKPSLISLLEHGKEPWEAKGQVTRSTVQGENSRSRLETFLGGWLHHLQRSLPGLRLPRNSSSALGSWVCTEGSWRGLDSLLLPARPFCFPLVSVVSHFVPRRMS